VVDLSSSSDEEDVIPDTSRDEQFTKRFFGDLNREVLGSPNSDKVIILSDSDDEEKEVCEEDVIDTKAMPSSAVKSPTPIASAADVDDADKGTPNTSNDGCSPNRAIGDSSTDGDGAGSP
jgi:hypothetical protein